MGAGVSDDLDRFRAAQLLTLPLATWRIRMPAATTLGRSAHRRKRPARAGNAPCGIPGTDRHFPITTCLPEPQSPISDPLRAGRTRSPPPDAAAPPSQAASRIAAPSEPAQATD